MQNEKILVAIAEDKKEDMKMIKTAIESLPNYKVVITAESGRELILKLDEAKKLPHLVLMDMQMPKCDGLLATIISKRLFQNLKIVGLSTHTYSKVINQFMAEGGDSFLSKFIVMKESAISINAYKDPNILEKAMNKIIHENEVYFDILCHYQGEDYKRIKSTYKIITEKFHNFSQDYLTLLQLNAAGFSRLECAKLLKVSFSTIKKYFHYLVRLFQVKNHLDLVNIAATNGIVKYFTLYQDFD